MSNAFTQTRIWPPDDSTAIRKPLLASACSANSASHTLHLISLVRPSVVFLPLACDVLLILSLASALPSLVSKPNELAAVQRGLARRLGPWARSPDTCLAICQSVYLQALHPCIALADSQYCIYRKLVRCSSRLVQSAQRLEFKSHTAAVDTASIRRSEVFCVALALQPYGVMKMRCQRCDLTADI